MAAARRDAAPGTSSAQDGGGSYEEENAGRRRWQQRRRKGGRECRQFSRDHQKDVCACAGRSVRWGREWRPREDAGRRCLGTACVLVLSRERRSILLPPGSRCLSRSLAPSFGAPSVRFLAFGSHPLPTMPVRSSNVVQPQDYKEAAALERKRQAELRQQSRWFNARERLIGGDYNAWAAQVQDRKIQEATEKAKHEMIGAEMRQNDHIACILDQRQRRDRRELQKAISEFQQTFQQPESRREFDLSDPLALKKAVPARVSDQDTSNTISGMQKFMGEDLNAKERKKAQEEQNREWALEQQRTWNKALADHKFSEDLFTKTRLEFDQTARDLQKLELATKRVVCKTVKDFNKNQMLEVMERKRRERRQEEEDNMAEITSTLQSDFLSENPQQAAGLLGSNKVVPYKWKGMTKEQLEEIWLFQKQQIHEKQRLREEERQRDLDWDRQRIQAARANLLFERQQQRLSRELRRAMDNQNRNLAQEHKDMQDYLKEQFYVNHPTAQYFTQFNTSSK
ncbi:LOW QUALITY PROTEIN: RIB43A-like with coiled-coils protein 2 [Trichosurus vulpecula]|uniref:LOW QUALITY PROTEIN: RIB43A-like with coiled-coils protein 2 n=1 Tax=Trichosurus vulpecula TaxID=9337 RepID=UPI00186AD3AD|nr:LOW QUALITY PROTEIN: RIB43A-like with coiled-coils protein 2 [Trichosurus vulpecula]